MIFKEVKFQQNPFLKLNLMFSKIIHYFTLEALTWKILISQKYSVYFHSA